MPKGNKDFRRFSNCLDTIIIQLLALYKPPKNEVIRDNVENMFFAIPKAYENNYNLFGICKYEIIDS